MIRNLLFFLLLLSLGSCSSFREMHFFSDNTPGVPNYYRLKVSGLSLFSSSRYVSGYYDPSAVDQYFNEIRQRDKAALNFSGYAAPEKTENSTEAAAVATGTTDISTTEKTYKNMATGEADERLVLIYSTNSDAVSGQIGLITENETTMDALAYLLYDDRTRGRDALEIEQAVNAKRSKLLVDLGTPLVTNLSSTDSQAKVYASLLQYLNTLALELGNTTPFSNFEEAKTWLERNRSGIINSTK